MLNLINIRDYDAFCFDLDGTIYIGNELLPGIKETLQRLRNHNKQILFITNSPTVTREECQQRLIHLGLDARLEEIFTATYLSALYFKEHQSDSKILIIGEEALEKEFNDFSLCVTNDPIEASHVLVGMDRHFTYEKLNKGMFAVMNGAKLVLTNPDNICPVPEGYIADTLAIGSAIAVAASKEIDFIIGKPSSYYGKKILEKVATSHERCLIIGDRLETDIALGKQNNCRTCLVLTGSTSEAEIEEKKIYPDYIVRNMYSFLDDTNVSQEHNQCEELLG